VAGRVATGATAKAACQVARAQGASRAVLAVPISGRDIAARFSGYADAVVCLHMPEFFFAVGQGYCNFTRDLRRRGDRAARLRPGGFSRARDVC
jgi:predicted phosphoribosyltransferase